MINLLFRYLDYCTALVNTNQYLIQNYQFNFKPYIIPTNCYYLDQIGDLNTVMGLTIMTKGCVQDSTNHLLSI